MIVDTPNIPGFKIERVLGIGATSVVYRVSRGGSKFALKLIKTKREFSEHADMLHLRFLKEAATIAKLHHPGLTQLHEIGETEDGRPYLVMELIEGESLKDRLARAPLNEFELIKLAKAIAPILDYFHCRGVTHKDLKPDNILLTPNGEVKLIDFGFAGEINDIRHQIDPDSQGDFLGTLQYAAPEQTGLLKQPVDSRSDLYAFGGVLYHCATGRPAFEAKTAIAMMALQTTGNPTAPATLNPAIRASLSALILKLLAKDPDERYQSARGLLFDLENLDTIELSTPPYPLGQNDSALRTAELEFVGRRREMADVMKVCDMTRANRGSVLVVAGEGGSGKTRILRELYQTQQEKHHHQSLLFLFGKARSNETIPFGPLREAIDDLLVRAQHLSELERTKVLNGIRTAAGDLGAIIRRLSPGLNALLGNARDIPPLDGNAEQERFYSKVADFFLTLPKVLGPIVLVIDDIQWLDDGTLAIIRKFGKQINSAALLLATTSRNDPASQPALDQFLAAVHGAWLTYLTLKPLQPLEIEQLVAVHLGGKPLDKECIQRITAKANGNPFALGEYLRALMERGVLKPTETKWIFDSQDFEDIELPDDVIQLLLNRISTLSPEAVKTLSLAAVIGYEFDFELLVTATGIPRESINRALNEGLQRVLIERTNHGFCFVHDRVSEALIRAIPMDRLQAFHQLLAETLERENDPSAKKIYALARHYFNGFPERNPEKVFQTSLTAAIHALENFSNEEALELLRRAVGAAQSLALPAAEHSRIYEYIGLACARTGRQQQAIESFHTALEQLTAPNDRARLHYLLGLARGSEGNHERAKEEFFIALQLLNEPFPKSLASSAISALGHWVGAIFRMRTRIGYGSASGDEKVRRQLISKINNSMVLLAYLLADELLMVQSIVRELHNVQFLGMSVEAVKAHVYYGILAGFLTRKKVVEKHGRLAVAMAQQIGLQEAIAFAEFNFAMATEFAGDSVRSYKMMQSAYPKVIRYCSAWDKSTAIGHRTHILIAGKVRENLAFIEQAMPILQQTGDFSMLHTTYSSLYSCHQMLGNSHEALNILKKQQKELPGSMELASFTKTVFLIDFILGRLVQEELGPEIDEAIAKLCEIGIDMYHSRPRFAIMGLVRVEQTRMTNDPIERKNLLRSLKHFVWRSGFPFVLTPLHLCLHYVIKGSYHALRGNYGRAERCLWKAEQMARTSDNPWSLWLVARERARIAEALGHEEQKNSEAQKALKLAADSGWLPLVNQIQRDFGVSLASEEGETFSNARTRGLYGKLLSAEHNPEISFSTTFVPARELDLKMQALGVMDELIKSLGAERALLFVNDKIISDGLKVRFARSSGQSDLADHLSYSKSIINAVAKDRLPIVFTGENDGRLKQAESLLAHSLRSVLATPIVRGSELLGVLYLDSTLATGIFSTCDLEIVQPLIAHLAEAMDPHRDIDNPFVLQRLSLPKQNIINLEQIKLASFHKASQQSGGDWWWYNHDQEAGVFSLLAGDSSFHSAEAEIVSAAISGVYHTFKDLEAGKRRVVPFLELLESTLNELPESEKPPALAAIEIDLTSGHLNFWFAGSAPPIAVINAKGNCRFIMPETLSLPNSPVFEAKPGSLQLDPGDRIVLFSHGLAGEGRTDKNSFNYAVLEQILKQTRSLGVEKVSNAVIGKLLDPTNSPALGGRDISFVVLDFQGFIAQRRVA